MRWFLLFWGGPILFLGGWYWLSYHDMNFGIFMLTRQTHDTVFRIYGETLGLPPEVIPALVAKAIVVDSLLLIAIIAFRRRAAIIAWVRARMPAPPVKSTFSHQVQPVQRPLQDEAGRRRVHPVRPFGTRNIHLQQSPSGSNGG